MSKDNVDGVDLEPELAALPMQLRVAFGAACCERIFAAYDACAGRWGPPHPALTRQALDWAWATALGLPSELPGDCEAAIPASQPQEAHAEFLGRCAATGVCNLITFIDGEGIEDLEWTVNQTMEAVYSECEEQQSTADDPEWQAKIAAHPLWQQERARQRRDLMETDPQAIRARAEQENALVLAIS